MTYGQARHILQSSGGYTRAQRAAARRCIWRVRAVAFWRRRRAFPLAVWFWLFASQLAPRAADRLAEWNNRRAARKLRP